MDFRQMMMQAVMGRANPMMQQVLQMRQRGMSPQQAAEQMSRQYPQFQLQNQQQMNQMVNNAMQSAGVNPNELMAAARRFL